MEGACRESCAPSQEAAGPRRCVPGRAAALPAGGGKHLGLVFILTSTPSFWTVGGQGRRLKMYGQRRFALTSSRREVGRCRALWSWCVKPWGGEEGREWDSRTHGQSS